MNPTRSQPYHLTINPWPQLLNLRLLTPKTQPPHPESLRSNERPTPPRCEAPLKPAQSENDSGTTDTDTDSAAPSGPGGGLGVTSKSIGTAASDASEGFENFSRSHRWARRPCLGKASRIGSSTPLTSKFLTVGSSCATDMRPIATSGRRSWTSGVCTCFPVPSIGSRRANSTAKGS